MKQKPLISVIVPVYRVEEYLNQCIQSIVRQTYQNLEIILVDDGSPDRCPEICDQWREKDTRITVIHQLNGGGGKARNRAIDCLKGEYVAFVDSDDYISPNMLEVLYSFFSEEVDIVECDYCKVEDNSPKFSDRLTELKVKSFTVDEAMRENINEHYFQQVIWNKLYRRNVIGDIRFPEGKLIDDEFWTYKVIGNSRNLIHVEEILYAYRQQPQSVMHISFSFERLQTLEAHKEKIEFITHNFPELRLEEHKKLWIACLYMGQMSLKHLEKKECREAFKIIRLVLDQYPFSKYELQQIIFKYKIWWYLTKFSLEKTCKIRNFLKIGV